MAFEFDFRPDQIQRILHPNPHYVEWQQAMVDELQKYEITSVLRVAMFLAQTGHESNNYHQLIENLNYRASTLTSTWPKRFPRDIAAQYAHNPEAIANRAYCNRMGNGDEASGDGWQFCGRGLIQMTGRENYEKFAQYTGRNINDIVAYCETSDGAIESACFFWKDHELNRYSDESNVTEVTKIINGGDLGLEDRADRFEFAVSVLQG